MREGGDTMKVAMLPWSAFGHLTSFFQLALALAKAGVHVSFISTPRNIQRLPEVPSTLAHLIDMVELLLPLLSKQVLPEGAEATVDIPFEKVQYLKQAYDQLQYPVKQIVGNHLPDWIICDFSCHWVIEIAHEFEVKLVFYSVFSAATLAFFGFGVPDCVGGCDFGKHQQSPENLTVKPDWVTFPSTVAFPKYEAAGIHAGMYIENASGISDSSRVVKILDASHAIAVRSCYEIEGEYLNLYQKLLGKPVIPTGLLPPASRPGREITDGSWGKMSEWFNKQEPNSVIFVGLGSECKLSKDQVFEIAYGVELSQLPFLWALRKPSWATDDHDSVPLGFGERSCARGIVCMESVPQHEILAHPSVGGSFFHAGWGSAIESLQFGHSLVVLPFVYDQSLNARFLVDMGLAIEVKRSEDGSFGRDDIAQSLRQAMLLEEGEKLRIKTREAAKVVGDLKLHQDHYITAFVQFLKNGIPKQI